MGTRTRGFANNISSPGGVFDATDLNGVVPATNIANSSLTNVTDVSPSLGYAVSSVASDPPAPDTGQMWYNTTSNVLKFLGTTTAGAWAAGGNLGTARSGLAGAGTQTSALGAAGYTTTQVTNTEEYDGTSWTAGGNLATARSNQVGGTGTQTSALVFGGEQNPGPIADTEEYDGTSWTAGGNLPSARYGMATAGTQTSALSAGGNAGYITTTNEYDGTSWGAGGALASGRQSLAGAGTQTSALAFGGFGPIPNGTRTATEEYDGTSWTSGGNLNTARYRLAGSGTQTLALAFGGLAPGVPTYAATEAYNGTSWTNETSMSTARQALAGAKTGTQSSTAAFGGYTTTPVANTEEFTGAGGAVTRTVTGS